MDKTKLRPILLGTLFGVLSLYALSLLSDSVLLQKKNRNLLEESRQLQTALEQVQKQNHSLLDTLETHKKEASTFNDQLEQLKKENQALQVAFKKNNARIDSVAEEKSYLEEMLINKTKQIEILNAQKGSAQNTVSAYSENSGTSDAALAEKDEELRRLNEQNHILQEKLDRLYKTTSAKMNEINIAKIALEETVSTAKKKIEDEWNTVNLGSVTTGDQAPPRQSKSEGHVLAINDEHGFVVIDLGKADNLSSDATLEVKKNGEWVATLSVLEIRDVMAACNIKDLQDGRKIEINDPVSILR